MAVTAAVQLGWLGTAGLAEVALRCARGTRYCREPLLAARRRRAADRGHPGGPGVRRAHAGAGRRVHRARMADEGFLGGLALDALAGPAGDGSVTADEAAHGLLVAVTERRTRAEIDAFVPGAGQGGAGMTDDPAVPTGRGPPAAGRPAPRSMGDEAEPTLFELSQSGPARLAAPDHRRARVDGRRAGPGRAPAPATRWPWPRCPSGTWWPTSPGSATASSRSTSGAYPLGSCTMKYNPKVCDTWPACPAWPGSTRAPRPRWSRAGWRCSVELEEALCEITGMAAATLQPAAGAAGELTGLLLDAGLPRRPGRGRGTGSSSPTRPTAPTRRRSPSAATRWSRCRATPGAASTWPPCARSSTPTWPGSC